MLQYRGREVYVTVQRKRGLCYCTEEERFMLLYRGREAHVTVERKRGVGYSTILLREVAQP